PSQNRQQPIERSRADAPFRAMGIGRCHMRQRAVVGGVNGSVSFARANGSVMTKKGPARRRSPDTQTPRGGLGRFETRLARPTNAVGLMANGDRRLTLGTDEPGKPRALVVHLERCAL